MILAAGFLCLAACQREDLSIDELKNSVTYIRASEESSTATKASIDNADASFTWNTNDRIAVYADGYKISDGLADTYNNTNAATFAFSGDNVVVEENRANFAIFPASLVWDGTNIREHSASQYTASALTITLPASYTLAEVQDELSPCPMIATNAPNGDLSFKHLCALLRVTVSDVPATTRRLVFVFNGNKVQGEFTLTEVAPGTSSIVTAAAEGTNNVITVFTPDIDAVSTLTVNLPLPTGTYDYITISAYDRAEGGLPIYTKTRLIKNSDPGTWTSNRLSSRKISAALNQIAFSVSSTKKVLFSPGNLQATTSDNGTTWTWQFAANQWDFMGSKTGSSNLKINGNGTVSVNGTVDLFAWVGKSSNWGGTTEPYAALGTTENAAMHGITNATTMGNVTDYGNTIAESLKSDWGESINDGNVWRTLNKDEWKYVLAERSGGTVNGTNKARLTFAHLIEPNVDGFILFPDGVTLNSGEADWGKINGDSGSSPKTQCTIAQWTALEAKGCVFLPAAGQRRYFSSKWELTSDMLYWSSSYRGGSVEQATAKSFDNLTGESGTKRQRGCAVRLVRNL